MKKNNPGLYILKKYMLNEYFPKDRNDCFMIYHYTSCDSLIHIMGEEHLCFHASRVECMNDKEEALDAIRIYKECCKELLQNQEISKEYYDYLKNIGITKKMPILYRKDNISVDELPTTFGEICECEIYIICFSEEQDSLPMWNYYSNGTAYEGINIGFAKEDLEEYTHCGADHGYSIKLLEVLYDDSKKKELVKSLIKDVYTLFQSNDVIMLRKYIESCINDWSICFKNPAFEHEKECRLVYCIPKETKGNDKSIKHFDVNYRVKNGIFIPYIEENIPKDTVHKLTLGPLLGDDKQEIQKQIIEDFLRNRGYDCCIEVNNSRVPIRY